MSLSSDEQTQYQTTVDLKKLGKKLAQKAVTLFRTEQYVDAIALLNQAIEFKYLKARAILALLLVDGEGVDIDCDRAFQLVEEGMHLGCHHCQGVISWFYLNGFGCIYDCQKALNLAYNSSNNNSMYGHYTLGWLYYLGIKGLVRDYVQAVVFFQHSVLQGLSDAQCALGHMYYFGLGVNKDQDEALRLWQLAAAQGHWDALLNIADNFPIFADTYKYSSNELYRIAHCFEKGYAVFADEATAIYWYKRALEAGHPNAADTLKILENN